MRSILAKVGVAAVLAALPPEAFPKDADVDEKAVRLQVWLDRQNFGPGKIDGKGGEFTSKALDLYKAAHPEMRIEREPPGEFQEPTFVDFTIREEDFKEVGSLPKDREEQSRLKRLPYPTMAEFVAERYHADVKFLKALNSSVDAEAWKAGDVVKVPNVEPFEIEKLRQEKSPAKEESPKPERSVQIDTQALMLKVLEAGKMIAAFPVTCGSEQLPAPPGEWKVEQITKFPPFRWDLEMLKEGRRGKDALHLPPGPRNPVGVMWMALNKPGIGIHGTDSPATIGRSESHGCIRLSNWDAVKVAGMIAKGTPVTIK